MLFQRVFKIGSDYECDQMDQTMQNMMKAFICLVESRASKKGLVVESKF